VLQTNGEQVPPGTASRLNACSLRLEGMGFPAIGIASGVRSRATQEAIFRDRYQVQATGNGPYGDVRWWQGQRWVRVKAGGTVLPPDSSTHQDPPATGEDLTWPYNNRYTAAHAALVSICEEYGIRWTGRWFVGGGEDWHFDDMWDPYASFAGGGATPFNPEEDDMANVSDAEKAALLAAAARIEKLDSLLFNGAPGDSSRRFIDVIYSSVTDTANRVRGPLSEPFDMVQRIRSVVEGLASSMTPSGVDVPKLMLEMETRLRDAFISEFEAFSVAIRAEVLAGLGGLQLEGMTAAQVQEAAGAAIDERLRRIGIQLTIAPAPAS
jgi:hypothetical protein